MTIRTDARIIPMPGGFLSSHGTFGGGAGAVAVPWWTIAGVTCLGAYQFKGAASYAASLVNLAAPGTDDLSGVAPAWDTAIGATFNGVDQYLKVDSFGPVANTGTVACRYANLTGTNDRAVCLVETATGKDMFMICRNRYRNGNTTLTISDPVSAQIHIGASTTLYRDGVYFGDVVGPTAGSGAALGVACTYDGYGIYNYYACTIVAFAFYATALSAAQELALNTAMAAL